jgi:hypothetical protein
MSKVYNSWNQALGWKPDFAVVANAAPGHVDAVVRLVDVGVPVLVEKPLCSDAKEAQQLADFVASSGTPVLVGYCLRHHRTVRHLLEIMAARRLGRLLQFVAHVGQHVNDWRNPSAEYNVSLRADLGGGALLELSHEIDLALKVIGRPTEIAAKLSEIDGWQVEGAASLLLSAGNSSASITMNMVERPARRTMALVGSEGSVLADLISGTVVQQIGDEAPEIFELPDHGKMYVEQIRHFLRCVDGLEIPVVSVADAASVVDCIERARNSSMGRGS